MRCPWCGVDDDRVVDSRAADAGEAIRRRRHCAACGRRFTTYERIEDVGLVLLKRDGSREPWDRDKLEAGIRKALTGRPVTNAQIDQMLDRIEARIRKKGPEVASSVVGAAALGGHAADRRGRATCATRASTRTSRRRAISSAKSGLLLEKKEPAKRRKG